MASLLHYAAFMIFFTTTLILSASHDENERNEPPGCENPNTTQSLEMFKNLTKSTMDQISKASLDFSENGTIEKLIITYTPHDRLALSALTSCRQLFSLAMYNLNNSLVLVETRGNIKTWLCAAADDLQTCLDGFDGSIYDVRNFVFRTLKSSIDGITKSNGVVSEFDTCYKPTFDFKKVRFPYWLSYKDRKVSQSANVNYANIVVAKDGTGNYSTIGDAVKAVPYSSNNRLFIYVKKGIYNENVKIDLYQWNVMMFGDGMNETIVSGNLSHADGVDTFSSATFAVFGQGFIARDIGFSNTAGAIKEQAVALMSAADQSVFYRCRVDGYQDTLYVKSNRQFYRECHIYGTIDFIFGSSAVVIQSSIILAKRPLQGQKNTITANRKADQNCQTGITIQACRIQPAEDLSGVSTFLGRPWDDYSTVVFMQNYMESLISPKGWLPWNESQGDPPPPSTIFLAEYNNTGPGANVADRVKWKGVSVNLSYQEASKYTVQSLINGDQWLPATNVSFSSGL